MQTLEPKNDLEIRMLALEQGEMDPATFFDLLLNTNVFMPVKDDNKGIQGFQASTNAVPLAIDAEDGTKVLILFSAPERAAQFLTSFDGYEGGILESMQWILQKMGAGFGISINPGWNVGLDLDPDMVHQLAAQAAAVMNP